MARDTIIAASTATATPTASTAAARSSGPGVVEWEHLDKKKFYVLAPLASLATRFALYPSNLVKTRLQAQSGKLLYRGTWDAFQKIYKFEGMRGLYKGFLPNSLGVIASQIYVTTFEISRHWVSGSTDNELLKNAVPGGVASLISQSVVVPVDIVSQRMMVHGQITSPFGAAPPPQTSTRQIVRQILKSEGPRGLFRGYWTSILTFAPSSVVWWAVYGKVRELQMAASPDATTHMPAQALAGATAGCITALATNPLDTIRTRLQLADKSDAGSITVRGTITTLLRQSGWGGLLKGATARMIHMAPNSVLMITAYEMVKRWSLKKDAAL